MKLTIFTPTYNRAHTLKDVYESLKNQTVKSFEWIIVDDGSTDDTEELIKIWLHEKKLNIKYFKQKNSGKHVAHNLGVAKAKGELFTCLDSDDTFVENAVEKILNLDVFSQNELCGVIALDAYKNGEIVGDRFPRTLKSSNWNELIFKHQLSGDKTIIFKTKILRKFNFPENEDKHMPPSYQLFLMSGQYKFLLSNEVLKIVEYLEDGITRNIRRQYERAPHNYMLYRLLMLSQPNITWRFKIKTAILYNVAKHYSKNPSMYSKQEKEYHHLLACTKFLGKIYYWKIEKR